MSTQHAETRIPVDTVANRLLLARAMAGHLSIREAALKCNLGRGAWQNWERGVSAPPLAAIERIADTLGVDRVWLTWGGPLREQRGPEGGPGLHRPTGRLLESTALSSAFAGVTRADLRPAA